MRRRHFSGRCDICHQRKRVRWIERGYRTELARACGECEEDIRKRIGKKPLPNLNQGVLFHV